MYLRMCVDVHTFMSAGNLQRAYVCILMRIFNVGVYTCICTCMCTRVGMYMYMYM